MSNSLTGSITWDGGSVTLAALTNAEGTYAMYCMPAAPEQQIFRHHIPGVDGNIVVMGGRMNQQIHIGVMYISSDVAQAISDALADFDGMSKEDCTVEMCGNTWERCHLRSATPGSPARPIGALAGVIYDLTFDCDN